MRVIEILIYEPDDPVEQEEDAGTTLMQQLGNAFTRSGLVKALPGFRSVGQQLSVPATPGPSDLGSNGGYNAEYVRRSATLGSAQLDPRTMSRDSRARPVLIK